MKKKAAKTKIAKGRIIPFWKIFLGLVAMEFLACSILSIWSVIYGLVFPTGLPQNIVRDFENMFVYSTAFSAPVVGVLGLILLYGLELKRRRSLADYFWAASFMLVVFAIMAWNLFIARMIPELAFAVYLSVYCYWRVVVRPYIKP